jgi:hypothetical protein
MTQPFFKARVAAPSMDLRVTTQSRANGVAGFVVRMFLSEFACELGAFGSRSNEAHVAAQNVPELWEFIQTETAQIVTQFGASWIIGNRPDGSQMNFGILVHAPEFQDGESMTVQADASLAVEDRAAIAETYGKCYQSHQRKQDDKASDRYDDVDGPLDCPSDA